MHDFTLKSYENLIQSLQQQAFLFLPFKEFIITSVGKALCLRHDVDLLPFNSLVLARIQADMGIRGSYYFRVVPGSWDEDVIKEIAGMGHEIGYHYEDLSFAWAKFKATGDRRPASGEELERTIVDIAIESFSENLERLRKIVPVRTICMHGSPMSRWDSRLLWKYYDYKDFGIVGEPYFDVDFGDVMYLTDTGRRWDGEAVSIRDKVHGGSRVQGAGYKVQGENPYLDWKVKPIQYREETIRLSDKETEGQRNRSPITVPIAIL